MEQQAQQPSHLSTPSTDGRPWLASCLLQRQVVNVSTLEPLGRVTDIIFDPQTAHVVGVTIHLQNARAGITGALGRALGRRNDIGVLAIEHVVALNGDVVMVDADPTVGGASHGFQGAFRLTDVCELVILTTYGMSLGSLSDLLLAYDGATVAGYVVKPTELADTILPRLDELVDLEPNHAEGAALSADASSASRLPSARFRVIPASSRIRFGDSLILLFTDVEPLQPKMTVITQQTGVRSESRRFTR